MRSFYPRFVLVKWAAKMLESAFWLRATNKRDEQFALQRFYYAKLTVRSSGKKESKLRAQCCCFARARQH